MMRDKVFHYRWEWRLQSSPDALWSFVSDTNRFNRDTGVPAIEQRSDREPPLNARRHLRFTRFGVVVEWYEDPFEWVRPYRFGVLRRYLKGPVAEMRVLAQMNPSDGGTHLVYEVWAKPRNVLGLIAIPVQIGLMSRYSFGAAFRAYDQLLVSRPQASPLDLTGPVHFPPGGRDRLRIMREQLAAQGAKPELLERLVRVVETADDLSLAQIRPYVLADQWGYARREVLELCLLATRVGLLNMRWWLLCPLCRGPKQRAASLGEVNPNLHCDVCNIDFTANFERSVELVFYPNPAVRQSDVREFCIAGPQVTPHVVSQQLLGAGESRALTLPLERGRYRLRALNLAGGQALVAESGGADYMALGAGDGWSNDEIRLGLAPTIALENRTGAERLFILERTAWSDQAATAAEVIALQAFRDLFANEALRPGERISVGSQVILFTDLRDSTLLYRKVGDAVAFGQVMSHFDVLREAISAENGAIVKFMGDAVMGVFRTPVAAIRAMIAAQKKLASSASGAPVLWLKSGVHYGPCVAVTLNDRLDYFGSTVNIASRLEKFSNGGDIIISAAVHNDPEVLSLLHNRRLRVEPFEARLKGYEDEKFDLWRITPELS